MATLTVRALDAAKPKQAHYKLTVDRGLYLRVDPNGGKTWLVRYSVGGLQRQLRLPKPFGVGEGFMTLADARTENAKIQALARDGIDPQQVAMDRRRAEAAQGELRQTELLTVGDLFESWLADGVRRADGNTELRRAFTKDVLPTLGSRTVRAVTEHDLRSVLRSMVVRGVDRMAVRVFRDLRQMFAWAERRQPWRSLMVDGNAAELVEIEKIVSADYDMSEVRNRTLADAEILELRDIFAAMDSAYAAAENKRGAVRPLQLETRLALWICLGTLCRIGELLKAEWRHVDLDQGRWFIPKDNVKGAVGKKQDHLIFLSAFALRHFTALHKLTGQSTWCFPAPIRRTKPDANQGTKVTDSHVDVKSVSKQVGDRQATFKKRKPLAKRRHDDSLVLSRGRRGEWTPHDLRRTSATLMQALGVVPDVIDRCQNHVLQGSRVRRHYLHHDYAKEQADAWARVGKHLESLLAASSSPTASKAKRKGA
jgi:integrase